VAKLKIQKEAKVPQVSRIKNTSSREPKSMEELLALSGYQIKGLKRGQQLEGIITRISSKAVFVDIGVKSEGLVAGREFEAAREYIKNLKTGDKVLVSVALPEDQSGQILLSLRKAAFSSAWKNFFEAKEKGNEVQVMVKEESSAGLLVEAAGLSGFIPTSQIGKTHQGKTKDLVGKKLKVKVIEIDQLQNRLVFSEKAVSEKEKIAKVKDIVKKVTIGQTFNGKVTAIAPFGIFVQIKVDDEEVEGLVHISEISWDRVDDPAQTFQVGEMVETIVIGKDIGGERLSLSIKQVTADPWQARAEKFPEESTISGKVIRLAAYGAFIELEEGFEGLLHISKIPPSMKIDVGDKIDCFVEKIEPEKRRISLGLVLKEKPVGYK